MIPEAPVNAQIAALMGWTNIHPLPSSKPDLQVWYGVPPDDQGWLQPGEEKDSVPIPKFTEQSQLRLVIVFPRDGGDPSVMVTDKMVRPYHFNDGGSVLVFRLEDMHCDVSGGVGELVESLTNRMRGALIQPVDLRTN
jgi:hypothetical protein